MMTHDQIIDLLSLAAARDRRTIGKADVLAWHTDIGDLAYDDCEQAISRHFRESTEWLLPAHIRAIVKRIRNDRLGPPGPGLSAELPAADPANEKAYRRALADIRTRVGDGRILPAIPAPAGEEQRRRQLHTAQQGAARARQASKPRHSANRDAVLAHPDLAARLCEDPIGYQHAAQWTGYIPPAPDSPRGIALAALVAEANRRDAPQGEAS